MNTIRYKGYSARIEYSSEDDCFVGHIAGINDIVGFHARSVEKLHAAFEEAVDDYIETCRKAKKTPQKSYSGHIALRIEPELHAQAAMMAEIKGESLNYFIGKLISNIKFKRNETKFIKKSSKSGIKRSEQRNKLVL